jgi:PAS domain S-box-containing protein
MVKMNFRNKIRTGFIIVFVIVSLTTLFAIWQLRSISQNALLIYEHPLKVGNTIREINIEMYKVARSVRDIVLTENDLQLDSIRMEMDKCDTIIQTGFEIIYSQYVGNKYDVDSAFYDYSNWQKDRNQLFRLKRENKVDSLNYLIKYKNQIQFNYLIYHTKIISEFAKNKADNTISETIKLEQQTVYITIVLLIIASVIVLLISYFLSNSITSPINKFIVAAKAIFYNQTENAEIEYKHEEELFNYLLKELKQAYQNIEQQNEEIRCTNEKLSDINSTLEIKVNERTNELAKKNNVISIQIEEISLQIEELSAKMNEISILNKEITSQNEEYKQLNVELVQVKEVLEKSESRFKNMFDKHNAVMLLLEPTTGLIVDANMAAINFYGYDKSKLCSMFIHEINPLSAELLFIERQKALAEERNHFIFTHRLASGEERNVEVHASPIHYLENQVLFCIVYDITERKKAEDALRKSEQRLNFYVEKSALAVVEWDTNFIVIRWTGESEKIFGWKPEETLGKPIMELQMVFEEDIPIVQKTMERLNDGISLQVISSNRNYTKDRRMIYCEWYNTILYDQQGKMISVMSQVLDITDRKLAEQKLIESKERYKRITIGLTDYLYTVKIKHGKSVETIHDENCFAITGYSAQEFASDPYLWINIVIPEDRKLITDRFEHIYESKDFPTLEHRIIRKDGQIRWISNTLIPKMNSFGELVSYEGVIKDVTARKVAENQLQETKNRLELIFNNSPDAVLVTRIEDGYFIDVNEAFTRLCGYTHDEIIGKTVLDINVWKNPKDRRQIITELQQKGECNNFEAEFQRKDGSLIIGMVAAKIIYLQGIAHILSVTRDISERKKIEETQLFLLNSGFLETKESFFESLARFLGQSLEMDYVCIDKLYGDLLKAQTVAFYYDGKFEKNVEYTLKDTPCGDVVGKSICCFSSDVRNLFPKDIVLQEMLAESYVGATLWSSDGKAIGLIATIGRKPLKNRHLAETILKLVAIRAAGELERKQAEEQIRQQNIILQELNATKDKFFSIIAHDLKSPFNSILGFSSLLVRKIDSFDTEKIRKFAETINNSALATLKLLENLLEWSRIQSGNLLPVFRIYNLKDILDEIYFQYLEVAINKRIIFKNNITSDIFIYCDFEMTKTIFRNLISNAIKFTKNDGIVSIQSQLFEDFVEIQIVDTGIGIKAGNLPYLFRIERNISTPGTNNEKGTGLGLLLCKELIEKQGGNIWVESQEGLGSTFHFTLKKQNNRNC